MEMSQKEMLEMIAKLQAQVTELKTKKASEVKPKAGRYVYVDRNATVRGVKTPQVIALGVIFKNAPKEKMTEAEAFEVVRKGHEAGILETDQDPVRIYRFYKNNLLCAGVIRQEG